MWDQKGVSLSWPVQRLWTVAASFRPRAWVAPTSQGTFLALLPSSRPSQLSTLCPTGLAGRVQPRSGGGGGQGLARERGFLPVAFVVHHPLPLALP